MAVLVKWPWLGVAIPCFLISFTGYFAHFFVLTNFLSFKELLWFQVSLSMIWISYWKAIYKNPGRPTKGFRPLRYEWQNYCTKCETYKPERTHHCKRCNQCVLVMDHHCPWTMNCVGYKNFPHFIRFLFWIIATTGILLHYFVKRIKFTWVNRYATANLVSKQELIFLTILTPLDAFILLTISLLFVRCVKNQIVNGRTQIEAWEMDRIENLFYHQRLLPQLLTNLKEIYPGSLEGQEKEVEEFLSSSTCSFDEVINFPYDINPWVNLLNCMGSPLNWLNPFGGPKADGMVFQKNEISDYDEATSIQDKLLALPWPPDDTRHGIAFPSVSHVEKDTQGGEQVVRRRHVPIAVPPRNEWYNDWGESLEHFGVDVEVE
ncbi:ACL003Cp [Eremothecium gossypii ATCC 10895]|uniref:Palmitoyltransferase PFA4 n=1 Tax=Eremothecium gossypii (strain ATCC 10895 / CBS 109.51 / FGSC 9923 / NRRL Y-1056) TaxID=284811 RepID=PFA4_EREGS|nr:ACL003Cp [Eremothecium gossypii ATCC 10895]Q75CB4.2 RecName: Full=Palmitoyltransferase PFA4; AltName: Full=Protein S-acyltransferase; Short=PAT; AltName: Full=Protein fatty acyltransferase 4 [Eremothecium gossypii ATCC 10895]AAS51225.2 ACL003Cp [Eremothecium gossypii ATCC 10895]AEY95516.1 FACL003Cp [Eremothecium gossypii FDAG1]